MQNPGMDIVYGVILYPYDVDGTLTFDFLAAQRTSTSYTIVRTPELKLDLKGGENAFIALRKYDQGNSQVDSITLWQNAEPVLIWKLQP